MKEKNKQFSSCFLLDLKTFIRSKSFYAILILLAFSVIVSLISTEKINSITLNSIVSKFAWKCAALTVVYFYFSIMSATRYELREGGLKLYCDAGLSAWKWYISKYIVYVLIPFFVITFFGGISFLFSIVSGSKMLMPNLFSLLSLLFWVLIVSSGIFSLIMLSKNFFLSIIYVLAYFIIDAVILYILNASNIFPSALLNYAVLQKINISQPLFVLYVPVCFAITLLIGIAAALRINKKYDK